MNPIIKRILLINLIVFVLYTIYSFTQSENGGYGMIAHAFLLAGHVATLLLAGIICFVFLKKDEIHKALFMSAGLVLLIGFGTCLGIAEI